MGLKLLFLKSLPHEFLFLSGLLNVPAERKPILKFTNEADRRVRLCIRLSIFERRKVYSVP